MLLEIHSTSRSGRQEAKFYIVFFPKYNCPVNTILYTLSAQFWIWWCGGVFPLVLGQAYFI